jgi:hypothetical protein
MRQGEVHRTVHMGPILGALGLKLAVLPDDEALARVKHRLPPRSTKGPKLGDAELGVGLDWGVTWRAADELAAALMRHREAAVPRQRVSVR